MENGRGEDSRGGLSWSGSRLRTDFAQIFCSRCKQLRNLLKCYPPDIEKCITMYYLDIESFISRVMEPVMLPFCSSKCKSFSKCGFYKRRHVQKDTNKLMFQCFLSLKADLLGRVIDQFLLRPKNILLSTACDKDIDEVFLYETKDLDINYFETINIMCNGSIGKLTEDIMSDNQMPEVEARQLPERLEIINATKPLKKEFFFKEKIP